MDGKVRKSTRKKPITPRSQIRSALRRLFLRSRERAMRLKMDEYTCQKCGVKQSKAKGKEVKVEVHHKQGIGNWNRVIDEIYKELLCRPESLETLCAKCHQEEGNEAN